VRSRTGARALALVLTWLGVVRCQGESSEAPPCPGDTPPLSGTPAQRA
jgi:hypothetical protein